MSSNKPRVSIIGLGYIGLPTSAVLTNAGYEVVGIDVNQKVVDVINRGEVHIVEPYLEALVRNAVLSGRLRARTRPEEADIFIIAVPTPFKNKYQPDLIYIERAVRSIAPFLRAGNMVILESTSPVGTTEKLSEWLAQERKDLSFPKANGSSADISLAYCPERVLPGNIISELVKNDRVVGGLTLACTANARKFYESFVRGQCIETDARTAELTKLTENSFRDVNIAFANELSIICDQMSINVWELIALANRHPRVNVLMPGPGVGGHCIAVDPWFIVDSAPESARLIRMAREVNNSKPGWVIGKVQEAVNSIRLKSRKEIVIACLGLSFKANIDDIRESPSLEIVEQLANNEWATRLLVVEPHINELPTVLASKQAIEFVDMQVAMAESDVVVLLVDHALFKSVNASTLKGKVVIDTRGIWQ